MAQTVQIIMTDDIDGGEATETVTFAIDGQGYEIDLHENNAAALREALAPYRKAGRKAPRASSRRRTGTTQQRNSETSKIRAWARENGYEVGPRGRIHQHIINAYHQAAGTTGN
ncbi:histone-like nucleoid-structuring protein Lsr2 [Kocuria marina]|uniref:histone-like nucleoid-structuring protein Lsr2 n=1 Tax=Kocuria marina TaxID=223184 RepID=UPI0011AAEBB2|nr:Lsr2 family protein [Kocuria indica]